MSTNTTNYNLVKPTKGTDNADIDVINTNMDAIDTRMKANADAAAAAETTASAAIPTTEKAAADGVATLDATAKVPITQIPNMDIAHLPTGIPAILLADGSISDTELEYINSLSSNAQTQITAIKTTADAAATNAALTAHEADYTEHVPYGGATTGAANTYALAAPAIAALTLGMAVSVKFNVDSTGASTLNWAGKGAKGIKKSNGTDVTNLKATGIYTLRYDGTNFILQGEGGDYGTADAPQVLTGYTVGRDTGVVNGSIPIVAGGNTITPSTVAQTAIAANRYTTSAITVAGDANLIAANITAGKTIFGVAGTNANQPKANGTGALDTSGNFNLSGLSFTPAFVVLYQSGNAGSNNHTFMFIGSGIPDIYFNTLFNNAYSYQNSSSVNAANSIAFSVSAGGFSCTTNVSALSNLPIVWRAFG